MRKVTVDDLDDRVGPASVSRPLSDALGTANLAANYYELAPGESSAYGRHAHADQEELFYVLDGAVTFRGRDGDLAAGTGDVVRVGPGEFQRCVNDGDGRATVLAVGAPRDAGETEILRECPDCGGPTSQDLDLVDGDTVVARCADCGAETGRFES